MIFYNSDGNIGDDFRFFPIISREKIFKMEMDLSVRDQKRYRCKKTFKEIETLKVLKYIHVNN